MDTRKTAKGKTKGRKIKDLPGRPVRSADAKTVRGGLGDGSVRFDKITDGTSNT